MATQIEARDGVGTVHKKRNGGAVRKKRGGLRSSGQRLREKQRHHNDFYDLHAAQKEERERRLLSCIRQFLYFYD